MGVLNLLWLICFPLALLSLLVSRRLGDRVQALSVLVLGCVIVVASSWELAVDAWRWDWLLIATGAFAVLLGSTAFVRSRR